MAEVDIRINGRKYELACRDGDEERLRALGSLVDRKATDLARSMGELNEVRQLLFVALLLADELAEELTKPAAAAPAPDLALEDAAFVVDDLADRVEELADRLENAAAGA